jgi:hypothetical protein
MSADKNSMPSMTLMDKCMDLYPSSSQHVIEITFSVYATYYIHPLKRAEAAGGTAELEMEVYFNGSQHNSSSPDAAPAILWMII